MTFLVFSVLPAPDSPVQRMLWFSRSAKQGKRHVRGLRDLVHVRNLSPPSQSHPFMCSQKRVRDKKNSATDGVDPAVVNSVSAATNAHPCYFLGGRMAVDDVEIPAANLPFESASHRRAGTGALGGRPKFPSPAAAACVTARLA